MEFFSNIRCPITKHGLELVEKDQFYHYHIPDNYKNLGALTKGLLDKSKQYFYPIFDDIIILHAEYALFVGEGQDRRTALSFDKKRVFDYYNEINYKITNAFVVYEDSPKWVDYREVSSNYMRRSFMRASRYYPSTGKYLLDIASGTIGSPEYMALGDGYDFRICVDISIQALIQAKFNMRKEGKQGIFICGDITNIPIVDNCIDSVLSQHTLYHIPKDDQKVAVNEMYRVAKPGSKIVIVYCWFYHSWFMNLSLHFIQLYRIIRHFAGKIYVKCFKSKPRLYFFAHSPRWFRKSFVFSDDIRFYCWRSTNKYFMNLYIHKYFFGPSILKHLIRLEDNYSKFMGTFGEYAAIVIAKR